MAGADEVIQELDIYVNPNPPGTLHSLQFPLRERSDPLSFDAIRDCYMTQTTKRLTCVFEYPNATDSDRFLHTLSEVHKQAENGMSQFVAFFRHNEVHLNEISHSHRLRPPIPSPHAASGEFTSTSPNPSFTGTNTNIIVPRARSSVSNRRSLFFEEAHREPHREILFAPNRKLDAFAEISKLFFAPPGAHRGLARAPNVLSSILPASANGILSLRASLKRNPLPDQVYRLLHDIQVLSLHNLLSLLNFRNGDLSDNQPIHPPTIPSETLNTVLKALRECSVYIHGLWVCKEPSPALSLKLQYIREFILLQFFRSGTDGVSRVDLLTSLPAAYATEAFRILASVAVMDEGTRRWRLKDVALSQTSTMADAVSLPETVAYEERTAWLQRESQIIRNLATMLSAGKKETSLTMRWSLPQVSQPDNSLAMQENSTVKGQVKGMSLTPKQQADVKNYIRDLYSVHGVIHGSRIMPLVRQEKQKPTSKLRQLTEAQIFEALKPLLLMLNRDKATAIRSWDYPDLDVYRNHIIEILQRGNASRETVMREVNRQTPIPMPEQTFRSIMQELGRFNSNEAMWSFKSGMEM